MRKAILALLISLLAYNLAANLVHADGMILPEALGPDYLVVRSHHVSVDIEGGHATTRVEQEFYNPHPFPVGGRYLFEPSLSLWVGVDFAVGPEREYGYIQVGHAW